MSISVLTLSTYSKCSLSSHSQYSLYMHLSVLTASRFPYACAMQQHRCLFEHTARSTACGKSTHPMRSESTPGSVRSPCVIYSPSWSIRSPSGTGRLTLA